jgi:hypothetical protein
MSGLDREPPERRFDIAGGGARQFMSSASQRVALSRLFERGDDLTIARLQRHGIWQARIVHVGQIAP